MTEFLAEIDAAKGRSFSIKMTIDGTTVIGSLEWDGPLTYDNAAYVFRCAAEAMDPRNPQRGIPSLDLPPEATP